MKQDKLIVFNDKAREHWCNYYNDPDGAKIEEANQNRKARYEMQRIAGLIHLALQHPKDPDCAMLISAVRKAVAQ